MGRHHPRWLIPFLPWTPAEAGIYRLNRVKRRAEHGHVGRWLLSSRARRRIGTRNCRRPSSTTRSTRASTSSRESPPTIEVADARLRSVPQPDGSGAESSSRLLVEKVKETQESELINNANTACSTTSPVDAHQDAQRSADAGRSRRADRPGVEGAGLLPRAPARDRGVRARVHAPRRAAADRHAVRLAVPHLARPPARARRDKLPSRAARRRSS